MAEKRYVRVVVDVWVDVRAMHDNEGDIGFSMDLDDPLGDAESLVAQRVDDLTAMVAFRTRARWARKVAPSEWGDR